MRSIESHETVPCAGMACQLTEQLFRLMAQCSKHGCGATFGNHHHDAGYIADRSAGGLGLFGHLVPGAARAAAETLAGHVLARLQRRDTDGAVAWPLGSGRADVFRRVRRRVAVVVENSTDR